MFTGIVEAVGTLAELRMSGDAARIVIRVPATIDDVDVGDSVALNGCCLTAVACGNGLVEFDAGAETLHRTNLGGLRAGDRINIERSLAANSRLGGHFVTGHIDCTGVVTRRLDEHEWSTFWFQIPDPWTGQLASKGSIAIDGVSLTLVDVVAEGFSVALIPHTLQVTTLGQRQPGDRVNVETDVLAKYVQRALEAQFPQDLRMQELK